MSGVLPGSVRDVRGCVRDVLLVSRFWSPALSGVSCRCPAYVPPCPAHVPPCPAHVPPCPAHVPPCPALVPPMSRPCPAHVPPCPALVPPVSRPCPAMSRPCPARVPSCPACVPPRPARVPPRPARVPPMSQNTTGQLTYTWTPFCCPRDFLAMPISCPAVFREPFASEGSHSHACNQTDIKIISAVHEDTRSRLSLQAQSSKEFKPYCE